MKWRFFAPGRVVFVYFRRTLSDWLYLERVLSATSVSSRKFFLQTWGWKVANPFYFWLLFFWKWWSWIVWMLFYILYGDRWHVSGIRYWRQSVICAWSHPFRKKRSSNKTAGSDLRQMTCQVSSHCLLSISVICRLTRYKTI